MLRRALAPAAALTLLVVCAPAQAGVKLRYSSTASFASGQYYGGSQQTQSKGVYKLRATVTLRRKRGTRWVGKGRLRWASVSFEGKDCFNADPNLVLTRKRDSDFKVTARLRTRYGRVVGADVVADPGTPGVRVERNPLTTYQPGACDGADAWWSDQGSDISQEPPPWRALFTALHVTGPRVPIGDWTYRSSGSVLATKRYPTRQVGFVRQGPNGPLGESRTIGDSWRLIRTQG